MIRIRYSEEQVNALLASSWELMKDRAQTFAMLVDCADIAELLGVKVGTVHAWSKRGTLPDPVRHFGGVPVWRAMDIVWWAIDTGRAEAS